MLLSPVAVLDVGSNSLHSLVGTWDGRKLNRLDETSVRTDLIDDVRRRTGVGDAKLRVLQEASGRFAARARQRGADRVVVVATEAVRAAANRTHVLGALREATDAPVFVPDPAEEALLLALGMRALGPSEGTLLLADVGGGSTQVAVTDRHRMLWTSSAPVGTGRLRCREHAPSQEVTALLQTALASLAPPPELRREVNEILVTGGGARRLTKFLGTRKLRRDTIEATAGVLRCDQGFRLALARGISPHGTEMASAAAAILGELLDLLGKRRCRYVPAGIREGTIVRLSDAPTPLVFSESLAFVTSQLLLPGLCESPVAV